MNTKEALKILRREGYRIQKVGDKYIELPENGCKQYEYSARDIIRLARNYTANKHKTSVKNNIKHYHSRRSRRISKNKIHNKQYDDLSSNKDVHKEDEWSWD